MRSLRFDESATVEKRAFGPVVTVVWSDERPPLGERPCHPACRDAFDRLLAARTYYWEHECIPEDLLSLWDEAREAVPTWPGFGRLYLDEATKACLRGARDLDDALHRAFFHEADEVSVELDEDGGFSFSYGFHLGKRRRPWWKFWVRRE